MGGTTIVAREFTGDFGSSDDVMDNYTIHDAPISLTLSYFTDKTIIYGLYCSDTKIAIPEYVYKNLMIRLKRIHGETHTIKLANDVFVPQHFCPECKTYFIGSICQCKTAEVV